MELAKASNSSESCEDDIYQDLKRARDFTGKVALVTGSSAGTGVAIAKVFSVLGANVVVTGRNEQAIKTVSRQVQQLSPSNLKPLEIVADLTKPEDVKRLIEETVNAFGKIDILVNNAAFGSFTSIHDQEFMQSFDTVFNINLRATTMVIHYAVPHLKKTNGTIINISSSFSTLPVPILMPYLMAKAAMDMMTKCLAVELGPHVRVNSVHPGATNNKMQLVGKQVDLVELFAKLKEVVPLKCDGQPIDIGKAVAFLASDDASFITGANLLVDGGLLYVAGGVMSSM